MKDQHRSLWVKSKNRRTTSTSQVWNGHLGRDHDERIDFDGVGGDEFGYENKEVSQILTTWIPSKLYDQHYP
jgi:hypothetical protein